jgi:hypothetical protein
VSIYSPSGHFRRCPLRVIFHAHPHFVQMYRPNAYPLRTHEHVGDLKSPGRGLGKATRRQRGRHRHARPPPPPRPYPQMWAEELENQNRLA